MSKSSKSRAPSLRDQTGALPRGLLHLLVIVVTFVLLLEGRDSAAPKLPVLFALAMLAASVYLSGALRKGALVIQSTPLDIPLLVFIFGALLSAALTWTPGLSGPAASLLVACALCFVGGSTLFTDTAQIENLRRTITAVTIGVAVLGLAQFFFRDSLAAQFFIGEDRRPASTLGSPLFLSTFIVLVFPFLLTHGTGRVRRGVPLILRSALLLSLVFLLLATGTRSSIASFLVSLAALAFLMRLPRWRPLLWSAVALLGTLLLGLLFIPGLGERLGSVFAPGAHSSFSRRLYILEAGFRAFMGSPWIGHGFGRVEAVLPAFRASDYWVVGSEDIVPHAHSELLEIGVELGLGGVLLAIVMAALIIRAGILCSRNADRTSAPIAAGVAAGLLGALMDGMMNVSLREPTVASLAALFAGLLCSPALTGRSRPIGMRFKPLPSVAWVPVFLFLLGMVPYGARQIAAAGNERLFIRAIIAESRGLLGEAATLYQTASQRDPLSRFALFNAARMQLATGRPREAAVTIQRLQRLSGDYPKSNLIKAAALFALRDLQRSSEAITRELGLRNHPEAYALQSHILSVMADTSGERHALRNLLEMSARGGMGEFIDGYSRPFVATSRSRPELEDARDLLRRIQPGCRNSPALEALLTDLDKILSSPSP